MSWNYRVLRHAEKPEAPGDGDWFAIHEVFYDEHGMPRSCSADPIAPGGETPGELRSDLRMMMSAFDKPALDYKLFEDLSREAGDDD